MRFVLRLIALVPALVVGLASDAAPQEAAASDPEVVVQTRRGSYSSDLVAISADGTLVAAAAPYLGEVVVWDVVSRRRLAMHPLTETGVLGLEFVLGGEVLLIETLTGFELWRPDTDLTQRWERVGAAGVAPRDIRTEDGQVIDLAVAISTLTFAQVVAPLGEPMAVVQSPAQTELTTLPGQAREVALDATGAFLAVIGPSVQVVEVAAVQDGASLDDILVCEFIHDGRYVEEVVLSIEGGLIAIESYSRDTDGEVERRIDVHELPSGELVRSIPLARGYSALFGGGARFAFAPDGDALLVDGAGLASDFSAALVRWPLPSGEPERFEYESVCDFGLSVASGTAVRSVPTDPLAGAESANRANAPLVFDAATGLELGPVQDATTTRFERLFRDAATGRLFATTEFGALLELDLERAELVDLEVDGLGACAVHDGDVLQRFASGRVAASKLTADGLERRTWPEWFEHDADFPGFGAWQVGFSADGRLTGASDGLRLLVVDTRTAAVVLDTTRPAPDEDALGQSAFVAFAPPGRLQLIDTEGWREEWDLEAGELIARDRPSNTLSETWVDQSTTRHMAWSEATQRLVIGSESGLRLKDPRSGVASFVEHGWIWSQALSPSGARVACQSSSGFFVRDLVGGEALWQREILLTAPVFVNEDRLLAIDADGAVVILDAATGDEVVRLFHVAPDGYVFLAPDGTYKATRVGVQGVALRSGLDAFSFSEDDLSRNRPDLVLERLGVLETKRIALQRRSVERRRQRLGVTDEGANPAERPQLRIASRVPLAVDGASFDLTVEAVGGADLRALHVSVDGVPVESRRGRSIEVAGGERAVLEVAVPLSPGVNVVSVAVEDAAGRRSFEHRAVVRSLSPLEAATVYVVALGVSEYAQSEHDLRFAAHDATAFTTAMRALHGDETRVFERTDGDVTREVLLECRAFLEQAAAQDLVLVHIAGHGLRDADDRYWFATHDIDFAAPAGRGISFDAFEDLLDGLPARHKVLLMDTCHAGDLAQSAGVGAAEDGARNGFEVLAAPTPPTPVDLELVLEDAFADLRRGTGAAVVAAAGGAEFAYETEALGGVFTRIVIDGLRDRRADLDGDGRLLARELVRFVADGVFEATEGRQRPVAKRENFGFDFPLLWSSELPTAHRFEDFGPRAGGYCPDGSRLWLTGSPMEPEVVVVEAETYAIVGRFPVPDSGDIVPSWDGSHLLIVDDESAQVLRVRDGAVVAVPGSAAGGVDADRFLTPPVALPDGRSFAVRDRDSDEVAVVTVKEPGAELEPDKPAHAPELSVRFLTGVPARTVMLLPDGEHLLAMDAKAVARTVSWRDGAVQGTVQLALDEPYIGIDRAVRLAADGRYALDLNVVERTVGIWDLATGAHVIVPRAGAAPQVWVEEDEEGVLRVAIANPSWSDVDWTLDDGAAEAVDLEVRRLSDDTLLHTIHIPRFMAVQLRPGSTRLVAAQSGGPMFTNSKEAPGILVHDLAGGELLEWATIPLPSNFRGQEVALLVPPAGSRPIVALGIWGRVHEFDRPQ